MNMNGNTGDTVERIAVVRMSHNTSFTLVLITQITRPKFLRKILKKVLKKAHIKLELLNVSWRYQYVTKCVTNTFKKKSAEDKRQQ